MDFGLSGDRGNDSKKGGTPIYASNKVFGGEQYNLDCYSYGRLILFLILDWSDFIQLSFMPIENQQMLETIQNGVKSFQIIQKILGEYLGYDKYGSFEDMSKYPKVLITRSDLIGAGVPQTWFIDNHSIRHRDTIQCENFNVRNLKYVYQS